MTAIAVPPSAASAAEAEVADTRRFNRAMWSNPDNGLWVARSNDGYLGMVEEDIVGYKVTDARGSMIGTFDDFETAKNIVAMEFHIDGSDAKDLRRAFVATLVIGATALSVSGAAVITYLASR